MVFKQIHTQALHRSALITLITALFCWICGYAAASVPAPRVKPDAPNSSQILSQKDATTFRLGMAAADRRSWNDVARYQNALDDNVAQSVLLWRRAVADANLSWDEFEFVTTQLPDWPRMTRIKAAAEKRLFEDPISARATVAYFAQTPPVSGEGRAALARAHFDLGNESSGLEWLRLTWTESRLSRDRQRKLFSRYKSRLTPADHFARADHLVWLGTRYYSSAEALLPHMSSRDRAEINARIRVGANRSGMDAAINALTAEQKASTGILFERARWRRTRKDKDYALPVFLDINAPASSEDGKARLWREQKIMAYWLIEEGEHRKAYNVIRHHGMTRGAGFASAEWLAGWFALNHMNEPQMAMTHFTRLREGVNTPVSLARAMYWQGRAAERMGQGQEIIYYSEGARFINTYYGQMAAARLSPGSAFVSLPAEPDANARASVLEARSVIKALRLIGETGNERVYRQFSFHLDDTLEDSRDLTYLGQIARDYGFFGPSVRAGKQGGRFDAILTETSYPIPQVIVDLGREFDIPFVLAIGRQESEFDTGAISHAKAYGMMQMIDATARATARRHGLSYSRSRMTSDRSYAARMGALHLNDLLEDYDGSYIMAAAAYNAGPRRVTRWVRTYGDPRTGEIDPIDWVESLPFSETRNYIQRVMENMQVYRARLNNNQAPLRIEDDMRRRAL